MTTKDKEHRSFVYNYAKGIIWKRKALLEEIEYAMNLLTPLCAARAYRAIGMKTVLEEKLGAISK